MIFSITLFWPWLLPHAFLLHTDSASSLGSKENADSSGQPSLDSADDKVINISDYMDGFTDELICLSCGERGLHVWPLGTHQKDLECNCGKIGTLIATGCPQTSIDLDLHYENEN
jgi:hypothetical protein